jgi:parvulin-like peptidyl-prolyl isomerase
MKKALVALCAFALMAGTSCGNLLSPAAAVVDGRKITIGEVEDAFDHFSKSLQYQELATQQDPKSIQRQFEQIYLTQLVRRGVFTPRASELGVSVPADEVEERIERIKDTYATEEEFNEALSGQGLTLAQLRDLIEDRIRERELRAEITAEASPTEDEIRAYYEENIDLYTETRVSHILVTDEALAQRLSDRLQSAPAKRPTRLFSSLARRYSSDRQSKGDGGDLGYFANGTYPSAFEDAVAEMQPGDVSDPVETELGWHVIYLTDRRPQPFEDVQDSIAVLIGSPAEDEAWSEWVVDAYGDADVKVNPSYGELDLDTQQIVNASTEDVPGTVPEDVPTPGGSLVPPESSP